MGQIPRLYCYCSSGWCRHLRDGPGLTGPERVNAVKRGQRLDETRPGSGLGLSIVADLAPLCKGRFELEPSPQGGLRARLNLPAA
jgi:signal transduction histidine kinase